MRAFSLSMCLLLSVAPAMHAQAAPAANPLHWGPAPVVFPMGARMAVEILTRLRFSSDQIARVEALVANHLKFIDVGRMRESTLKRFLRQPYFEEHLELHRLDCLSSHRRLESYDFCREKLAGLAPEELKPAALLSGHDLIAAGYRPGPAFGAILAAVEDAQLESKVASREEALELVRRLFQPPDGAPAE